MTLGNCLHLVGEKVSGKTKQFAPADFLRRAEKLTLKYCDNEMMLSNIRGSLVKIESITNREPSTMQSIKTSEQTGMVSCLSNKQKVKEIEQCLSNTASISSRMLKKSQFSHPKLNSLKKTVSGKNFRVTSNHNSHMMDQIKSIFSGVVQIKVEPNIKIVTKSHENSIKKPVKVRHGTDTKSIVCSHCHHHLTVNESQAASQHSDARYSVHRTYTGRKNSKYQAQRSSISSSGKVSREEDELSITSKHKIKVVNKEAVKQRRQSEDHKSNLSMNQKEMRASLMQKMESSSGGVDAKSTKSKLKEYSNTPFEAKPPKTWDEPATRQQPMLKTDSRTDIPGLGGTTDNFVAQSSSNFNTSPDSKSRQLNGMVSSSDEKQNFTTPVFPKKAVDASMTNQSRFSIEAKRQLVSSDVITNSNSQPITTKKELSIFDNYWQILGDKEYRVKLHKTIYEET